MMLHDLKWWQNYLCYSGLDRIVTGHVCTSCPGDRGTLHPTERTLKGSGRQSAHVTSLHSYICPYTLLDWRPAWITPGFQPLQHKGPAWGLHSPYPGTSSITTQYFDTKSLLLFPLIPQLTWLGTSNCKGCLTHSIYTLHIQHIFIEHLPCAQYCWVAVQIQREPVASGNLQSHVHFGIPIYISLYSSLIVLCICS